jgi:hypothetical protein
VCMYMCLLALWGVCAHAPKCVCVWVFVCVWVYVFFMRCWCVYVCVVGVRGCVGGCMSLCVSLCLCLCLCLCVGVCVVSTELHGEITDWSTT